MNRDDLGRVIVATAADVEAAEWQTVLPGVEHKVLWQSGDTSLGLMRVAPGAENPEHSHHAAHHHIYVLSGEATMLGRRVGPGAYVYIPPSVAHAVTDVSDEGCTFFYTYRPLEQPVDPFPLSESHGQPV
jgi:quercetin dioxygenase-like cupin family protein